jgi:hypothetical protein
MAEKRRRRAFRRCLVVKRDVPGGIRGVDRRRQGLQNLLGVLQASVRAKPGRQQLRLLAEDIHGPGDAAGAVSDRFHVHERHDGRAIRPLDRDLLIAYASAVSEDIGHRTFRMRYKVAVQAIKAIRAAITKGRITEVRRRTP